MRTLTFLRFVVCISAGVLAQEAGPPLNPAEQSERCAFAEVYRPEGWKIPGLAAAVNAGRRAALTTSMGGPVEGVFPTRLTAKPKANSIFHLLMPECPGEPPGRLVLSDILVKPLEMWRVDYEGNVFAYVATYEAQFVEKGVPHGTLKEHFLVFIDVDGAGKNSRS
jgi:hypothetical protein